MSEMPVSMKDGSRILFNLADRKVMSERHAEAVDSIWQAPSFKEDSKRNLWNLYNACTQHFTHNVEAGSRGKPRFELAERLNSAVMNTMVRAVRANRIEDLLVKLN
jgi:hypothetical protein